MSVNIVLETKPGVKIHYLSTQLVRIRNLTYSPRPSVHKCLSRLVSSKSTQRYVVSYPDNFMSPVAFLFFLFSASPVIQLLTNPFLSFQIISGYLWCNNAWSHCCSLFAPVLLQPHQLRWGQSPSHLPGTVLGYPFKVLHYTHVTRGTALHSVIMTARNWPKLCLQLINQLNCYTVRVQPCVFALTSICLSCSEGSSI